MLPCLKHRCMSWSQCFFRDQGEKIPRSLNTISRSSFTQCWVLMPQSASVAMKQFVFECVCVGGRAVYAHACMRVCMCMEGADINPRCCSTLGFENLLYFSLEPLDLDRLPGQWATGTCLSSPPECWDYKHTSLIKHLRRALGTERRSPCLGDTQFTNQTISQPQWGTSYLALLWSDFSDSLTLLYEIFGNWITFPTPLVFIFAFHSS